MENYLIILKKFSKNNLKFIFIYFSKEYIKEFKLFNIIMLGIKIPVFLSSIRAR